MNINLWTKQTTFLYNIYNCERHIWTTGSLIRDEKVLRKLTNQPGYGSPRDIVFFLHPSFDLSPIKGWNGRGPSANLLPKIGWNNNTSRERAVVKIERRRYSKTCGRLNYNPIPWWEGYYFYLKKEKSNSPFLRIPGIFICRRNERNYKRGGNLTGPFLRETWSRSKAKFREDKNRFLSFRRLHLLFPPTLCYE